jgi:hypothetical protein
VVSKPTDLDHAYENKVYKYGRRRTGFERIESSWQSYGLDAVTIGNDSDIETNKIAATGAEYDRCQ